MDGVPVKLPVAYSWLLLEAGPKLLKAGLSYYGVREKSGKENNPAIMQWASDLGIPYAGDDVPWCGLFMARAATDADWADHVPRQPLWARNWMQFGTVAPEAKLGDVLVFERGTGGHVGIYIGEDPDCYHVLGGNQGDAVSIVRIRKNRLLAARRPRWRNIPPPNRRRVMLKAEGVPSRNEA